MDDPVTFNLGDLQPGLVIVGNTTGEPVHIHRLDEERPHVLDDTCWCGPSVETFGVLTRPSTIGSWPGDEAPVQHVPLTSSEDRMHVLSETCWCLPNVLATGQGEDFRILEIHHQDQIGAGDRVAVDDPALAQLDAIFRSSGEEPAPNNVGTVESVHEDGTIVIDFDDGGAAPYPRSQVRRIA